MSVLNSTIIKNCWLSGSNDFQQRIPNPFITQYDEVISRLFAIQNGDLLNEFTGLLNMINGTYVESKRFENPLRALMKPANEWGNSERHVAVRYLQAHCGRPDDETLLKLELPEFREWFYSVQDPRRYEFSWPRQELQRAFATEGTGYEALLAATFDQAYSSDAYDEMQIMIQCFAEADNRLGNGLFRYNLSAAPTNESTAKELLVGVRATAGRMRFPTQLYNHIDIPVFENPETLVFWVTPEVDAVIDVQALAVLFNVDYAEVRYRKIIIPEFPIPNVYAALTSEDFIYARDVNYGMEQPFYNPGTRTYKYYLWHQELIGVNPVANCVLFTTDAATNVPTVTVAPSGMAFDPNSGTVEPGGTIQTKLVLSGTVSNDSDGLIGVEPDAGMYSVECKRYNSDTSAYDAVQLNSRTFVDEYGVLHVQKTGLETGDIITVTAKSSYINPSGSTTSYTATFTATIV